MADGDAPPAEALRACYEAFAARRLRRGARSIRTRQGFERLRDKFQPRLRFLHEATESQAPPPASSEQDCEPREAQEVRESVTRYSDEEEEEEEEDAAQRTPVVVDAPCVAAEAPPSTASDESEASALEQLVGVFFDARVKRFVLDTVWPLAHHGGSNAGGEDATHKLRSVPEWQELEEYKYFAFMFKALVWLFPGLPAFEAQELAEYDWKKDCEFDSYGSFGLSFEGFMVSILDLAVACTDNSTEKCIEFLKHLTKRLESSLPIFRVPTTSVLPEASETSKPNPYEQIVWRTVQLERLFPCPVRARPQFLEMKSKLSTAPVILMVLAGNERPIELQLSTSAKLLVRERDHRSSIRRNTMDSNALSHFIEIEKQFLWTFRSFPARPTLVIVPSGLISKRTLSLYACCRLLESHEHTLDQQTGSDLQPILTLFTAVNDPFPLLFGPSNSLCGRVDRQSSRVFTIDHRGRDSNSFKIIFKTSLIHNTSSAGGAGAAAIITSLAQVSSTGTARCKSELVGGSNSSSSQNAPHSFIFVVKVTSDLLANGPQRRRASVVGAGKGTSKSSEASVPAQWFTTLCGGNENKSIYVDGIMDAQDSAGGDASVADMYYVYVFTLHGFYFEATCEDIDDSTNADTTQESEDTPMSILTHAEATKARVGTQAPPGSIVYAPDGDEADDMAQFDVQECSVFGASTKSTLQNMNTSAALLRQLLHLRKQRQLRASAQPPPEFVGGSRITNVRAVTAAAGLRAKFLKARAEERRQRFLQNEEEFRSKVVSRLMKAESKKRALRGLMDTSEPQPTPDASATATSSTLSADLEAKATLMMNFFKEMAMYQPTQRELDEDDKAPVDQEEELLENFADLFHDDHALHNMLDQEKWMSAAEKATRRQSLINERMKTRRQSLVVLNKQQVPHLDDEDVGATEVQDVARKKSTATRASEDYYSTAMLINQLMREVAEEENGQAKHDSPGTQEDQTVEELQILRELAASWGYAASRTTDVEPNRRNDAEPFLDNQYEAMSSELSQLEELRRERWLSSHHVSDMANNERLGQYHATLRPTLVPTLQHFQQQEEELPWQPIWEVQEGTEGLDQDVQCRSPQQRVRPKTAGCAVFAPRPPSSSIGKDRSPAVKAATLARHHTRRIRSAHSKSVARAPVSTPSETQANVIEVPQQSSQHPHVMHVPKVFLLGSPRTSVEGEDIHDVPPSWDFVQPAQESAQELIDLKVKESESRHQNGVCENVKSDVGPSPPMKTCPLKKKPKRKKVKKLTEDERRFGGRVRELLSISPLIQSFARPHSP